VAADHDRPVLGSGVLPGLLLGLRLSPPMAGHHLRRNRRRTTLEAGIRLQKFLEQNLAGRDWILSVAHDVNRNIFGKTAVSRQRKLRIIARKVYSVFQYNSSRM